MHKLYKSFEREMREEGRHLINNGALGAATDTTQSFVLSPVG